MKYMQVIKVKKKCQTLKYFEIFLPEKCTWFYEQHYLTENLYNLRKKTFSFIL